MYLTLHDWGPADQEMDTKEEIIALEEKIDHIINFIGTC